MAIAERYAEAALSQTKQDAQADLLLQQLTTLSDALAQSDELQTALSNPLIATKEKQAVLNALADKLGNGETLKQLIALLAKNNRLDLMDTVIEAYKKQLSTERGELKLEVTTAKPLDKTTAQQMKKQLEKATGKPLQLETSVNPDILGGIIIRLGSVLLDHSVKGKLSRLETSLKQQIANA